MNIMGVRQNPNCFTIQFTPVSFSDNSDGKQETNDLWRRHSPAVPEKWIFPIVTQYTTYISGNQELSFSNLCRKNTKRTPKIDYFPEAWNYFFNNLVVSQRTIADLRPLLCTIPGEKPYSRFHFYSCNTGQPQDLRINRVSSYLSGGCPAGGLQRRKSP